MRITRRAAVAGAAAAMTAPAAWAQTNPVLDMPGYRAWTRVPNPVRAPLTTFVDSGAGPKRLGDWLGGRPTALALWATWCGPCLVEKPLQARMAQRLEARDARAQIKVLQAYDSATLENARRTLRRLNADTLDNARAMPDAEAAFIQIFGASPRDRARTSMPVLLLLDADGRELGRAVGTMTGVNGRTDYWEDEATFEFLSRL